MQFFRSDQFSDILQTVRSWFAVEASIGEYGCFWSSSQLFLWDFRTKKQIIIPAVLIRDQRTGIYEATGILAQKISIRLPEGKETIKPFFQGRVADIEAARVLFHAAFQELLDMPQLPLWFFPKLHILLIHQTYPIYDQAVQRLGLNLGCRGVEINTLSQQVIESLFPASPHSVHFSVVIIEEDIIEINLISRSSQQIVSQIKFGIDQVKKQLSFLLKNRLNLDISESELLKLLSDYVHRRTDVKVKNKTQSTWRTTVRGKDALKGELLSAVISSEQFEPLLHESLSPLVEHLTDFFEKLPGEYASDLMKQGVVLVETHQPFPGLSEYLATSLGIPFSQMNWQDTIVQPAEVKKIRTL